MEVPELEHRAVLWGEPICAGRLSTKCRSPRAPTTPPHRARPRNERSATSSCWWSWGWRTRRSRPALLRWVRGCQRRLGTVSTAGRPVSSVPPRAAFAGFRYPPEVILLAMRWYLRFGLSYRDVEELLAERGIGHHRIGADALGQSFDVAVRPDLAGRPGRQHKPLGRQRKQRLGPHRVEHRQRGRPVQAAVRPPPGDRDAPAGGLVAHRLQRGELPAPPEGVPDVGASQMLWVVLPGFAGAGTGRQEQGSGDRGSAAGVCCVSGRQDTLDPVDVLFRWRVRVL
jgi:hypothetical protein